jgi:hypothetical protein
MHRIVQHPNFNGTSNKIIYFATDGGIYQTLDYTGSSSFNLNNNLGITQFYGAAMNPTTGHIVGGTQDNGTLFYSGDKQDWFHLFGGDGGYGAADPTDPNFFYGEVQRALIHRSSDGGQSSSFIYDTANPIGDAGGLESNFIPFFMLDPNEPNRMLVACRRMWRSNNVKAASPDWFPIKDSIEPPGPSARRRQGTSHYDPNSPYNLSTIAVALGNANLIWAGHNNGEVYFTSNGTTGSPSWTRVDENGNGLPDRWISTIIIDPSDHNHVYVALMGWEPDNLWETTDGGQTWSDISGIGVLSIPSAPISALAIHPTQSGWLFVGTDVGLFVSHDNGATWSTNDVGPGTIPIEQLLWKDDQVLMAVTHGRGIFLTQVAVPQEVVADDFNVVRGLHIGGVLADSFQSDDSYLRFLPGVTLLDTEPPVWVEFTATLSAKEIALLSFQLEASANSVGLQQTIEFFNYVTNAYEQLNVSSATLADSTIIVNATGDVSRFVEQVTGRVKVRLGWKANGPVLLFPWTISIDRTVWIFSQ